MNKQFAVHNFENLHSASLNIRNYSALKFGSDRVARLFGYEMADKFYEEHYHTLIHNKCVIVPSAFNVVKIASTILAHHFMNRLNDLLTRNGHDIVNWSTMHRSMSYVSDYCTMSKDRRQEMLKGDTLYINRDFIEDKVLLFVDDATISGAHEEKMEDFLRESEINNPHIFCYYVRYTGKNAEIESRLNRSGIRTVDDYVNLVSEPNHHLVVRAIRFLLDLHPKSLKDALEKLDRKFIEKLYFACLAKNYHKTSEYHDNFELVKFYYDEINNGIMK